jgi:competence protein ComEA
MQLDGLGATTVDRILAARAERGAFKSHDELDEVPGIGPKTIDRLRATTTLSHRSPVDPAAPETPGPDTLTRKPRTAGAKINVNTANLAQLNTLPNIGPVLAQRMIDEREKKLFAKVEDLRRVSGIGPKRLEALRDLITFDRE